jgi:hypothetical protein
MNKLHLLIAVVSLAFSSAAHAQSEFYFELTGTDRGVADTLFGDIQVTSGAVTEIDVSPFTLNYGSFGTLGQNGYIPAGSTSIPALTFTAPNLGSVPSNNHVGLNGDGSINLANTYFFSNAAGSENISIGTSSGSNVSSFGGVFPSGTINNGGLGANVIFSSTPLAAPEPASWALMLGGLGLLVWRFRARRA